METHHTTQSPRVLLVVEDQPLIRMDAVEELRHDGWTVYEAVNADDAVEQLNCHPDITGLFTDIDMPGSMDGLELSHLARAKLQKLKIVVTSGMQNPTCEALPKGAVFISKPYQVSAVENVFQKLMG